MKFLKCCFRWSATSALIRFTVVLTFFPCGLAMGFAYSSLMLDIKTTGFSRYAPMTMGMGISLLIAAVYNVQHFVSFNLLFWHFDFLLVASAFNIIGGGLHFVQYGHAYGQYFTFMAEGMTFVCGLSYIHITSEKQTRSIYLALCYTSYFIGIASGASATKTLFAKHRVLDTTAFSHFPYIFSIAATVIGALVLLVIILDSTGKITVKVIKDEELNTANVDGKIFETYDDIIIRLRETNPSFYISNRSQVIVSFTLLFAELIFSFIISYSVFWLPLNKGILMTAAGKSFDFLFWFSSAGTLISNILEIFFSVKMVFLSACLAFAATIAISVIAFAITEVPTLFWFASLLLGIMYNGIKISIIETVTIRLSEVFLSLLYIVMLLPVSIIHSYCVSDVKNVMFYGNDVSIMTAYAFLLFMVMLTLSMVIWLQVPAYHMATLRHIQNTVLGIVFTNSYMGSRESLEGSIRTIALRSNTSISITENSV